MSEYVNSVRLVGDAKWVKRGASRKNGKEWLKFTLVTKSGKGKMSNHSVMVFDRLSSANVEDGSLVEIEGYLAYSKWEQDGVTSYPATVWAREVNVLGEKEAYEDAVNDWADSDDIPF